MDTNKTSRRSLIIGTGAAAVTALTSRAIASPARGTDGQGARTLSLHTFGTIDGVRVLYVTDPSNRRDRTWQCNSTFYITLTAWMRELKAASRMYGGVQYIRSIGFYNVDRVSVGHNTGRAMDLAGIRWTGGQIFSATDHHWERPEVYLRRRYLAVDAICRCWLRSTLDGWYNAAHHNHIHGDDLALPVRLVKSSRADTVFIQSSCNHFLRNTLIAVDGAWGPRTEGAYRKLRSALRVAGDPTSNSDVYRQFLRNLAKYGFNNWYAA